MSRKTRVPGMRSEKSFRIPVCHIHETPNERNDVGEWFCVQCFDAWLQQTHFKGRSVGGIDLPDGVQDVRRPSIKDAMVNRRWRRHAR